jgi:cation diffusion facilitator CzcD-associated flavoprotein CzcO
VTTGQRRIARGRTGRAETPKVIIVGAGVGGIASGVKLRRAGVTTFTIYEKSSSPGGTWFDNTYPGCEVDVGSYLYSFSFKQNYPWTRTHAKQPEILRYLETVVDDYELRPHMRLGVAVERATWDEDTHEYEVRLADGTVDRCHVLISAVGFLNVPKYPDWPGLDDFDGPKFHTFRWEHDHDLTGKRVAIVGTGSTASQIVPMIAPHVEHLYLFQREPGWIIPKGDRDYTVEELERFRSPLYRRLARIKLYKWLELANFARAIYRPGTKVNSTLEKMCRDFIDAELADRPDLRDAVTPDYPFPGKRPLFNSTFYGALKRDNVTLVPHAVTSVTRSGVVDVTGSEHPADVLVMATGFQPTNYLASLPITGRDGRTIQEFWNGEPDAFLGTMVPGFPNFFMLYGPNTNGGEIIFLEEHQAGVAVREMRRMMRRGVTAVEVRRSWYERYNRWIQKKMEGTSWLVSNNYFKASSGKVVTQWPYGALFYGLLTHTIGRVATTGRRLGTTAATPAEMAESSADRLAASSAGGVAAS